MLGGSGLPPLDLQALLRYGITALALIFGLLVLVRNAASRYFVVDGGFGGESGGYDARGPEMPGGEEKCFVCGRRGIKKCARCKSVRYCSQECQAKHWKYGHKLKCKEPKLSNDFVAAGSGGRRENPGFGSSIALIPARGSCKILEQPKKILFPYDEFVKLFNWDKQTFPPCGLLNCGNSCFANVVLQCLACTRPLVAYLLEGSHKKTCVRNDWCFLCELQDHLKKVRESVRPFSPLTILSRLPKIGGNLGNGRQEDAHEFMRFAIDTMQSICLDEFGGEKSLDASTQETTLIQYTFGGHLQSQVKCTKCDKISNRYESMMDLTVEIQGDSESLEDCLNQFTGKEWLDGENMYKCDGCNEYVKAWKRLTVHQPPNILTIALKRFQGGRFGKLNKRVTFPETLDLRPYMSREGDGTDLYTLYAVVVHIDMLNASFFGHYICYTKDFDGNWYRIDDCKVIKADVEEVLAQGAYMLLYSSNLNTWLEGEILPEAVPRQAPFKLSAFTVSSAPQEAVPVEAGMGVPEASAAGEGISQDRATNDTIPEGSSFVAEAELIMPTPNISPVENTGGMEQSSIIVPTEREDKEDGVLITSSHTIGHEEWREETSEIAEMAFGATEGTSGGAEEAFVAPEATSEMAQEAFGATEGASGGAEEASVAPEATSEMSQEAFVAPEVTSEMAQEAFGATKGASEVAQEAFGAAEVASEMVKETLEAAEGALEIAEEVPETMEEASEMVQEASGAANSDIFHMEVNGFPPHGVEWPAGLQFAAVANMHGVMSYLLIALEEFFTRVPLPSIEEARTFMEYNTRGWHTYGFPQDVWMAKMYSLWDEFGRQHLSEMLKRQLVEELQTIEINIEKLLTSRDNMQSRAELTSARVHELQQELDAINGQITEVDQEILKQKARAADLKKNIVGH